MDQPCPTGPAGRGTRCLPGPRLSGAAVMSVALMGAWLAVAAPVTTAAAEPLPLPAIDFALKANLAHGGTMALAHSQSRMRIEMNMPKARTPIVGLVDLKDRKMVMTMPNVPNMAVEIEVPSTYSLGALNGSGTKIGQSEVAGEPCDLWKIDPQAHVGDRSVVACITPDGIALRTEAEINGKKQVVYEATQVTRGPQDPKLFELPKDVQVMKMPKGKPGGIMGLPLPGAVPGIR